MSCNSCGGSCRPNRCRGVKASQFPFSKILTSSKAFRMSDDTQITYGTLLNSIAAALGFVSVPKGHFLSVAERDVFYAKPENTSLLQTDFPVAVNDNGILTFFYWNGVDNPSEYDPGLWVPLYSLSIDNIVEVFNAASYDMDGTESLIICTGLVSINMIKVSEAKKSFTVSALGGTVTMVPFAGDSAQTTIITSENAGKFGPEKEQDNWRDI